MTFEIAFMLAVLVLALALFVLEWLPMEVTALSLTGLLLAVGIIRPEDAVEGFSNKAVVTVGAMFLLSHGLVKTGLLEVVAERISQSTNNRPAVAVGLFLSIAALLSGFLNNTAVVAIFLPLAINLCRRFRLSPSKVLLPLSYAAILGGTLTLVGTSANLVVSSLAEIAGERPFGMFEFTPMGFILVIIGMAYILLFSQRALPSRASSVSLTGKYHMGPYLTEVKVMPQSPLVGKSCRQVGMNEEYDITAVAILRGNKRLTENIRNESLQDGDILILRGTVENILRLRREQGVALLSDIKLSDEELAREGQVLAEAMVTENSDLIGRTLKEIDFRQHYRAFVLAIRHHGELLREKIAHIPLRFSDTLLMITTKDHLNELRRSDDLIILSEAEAAIHKDRLWWLVPLLLPIIMILASLGVMEIMKGAALGVVLLLVLGVIRPQEAYRAVNWSVLALIAAFVPVGKAMVTTGTAQWVANSLIRVVHLLDDAWAPYVALALLYLVTMFLTQIISNAAAAIILPPVAFSLAAVLGVEPRPFLVAICFAASMAFMTPMGYQTNLMVYSPGNYRFSDFLRFGTPLSLLTWALSTLLIPFFWRF